MISVMLPRHLSPLVREALDDTPVVLIVGARQAGKSTLAASFVPAGARYSLDDLDTLSNAANDPAGFLSGLPDRALLDEVQRLPELLLSIKAAVDRDRRPGRLLLTGSANVLVLPRVADTLVGRLAMFRLWPLSQGELEARHDRFVDAAFSDAAVPLEVGATPDLAARVIAGGFPEALARTSARRRSAWFADYVETMLVRDVRDLSGIAGYADLPRLLRLIAARAAGLLNQSDLARDSGLNAVTFGRYLRLLEATYVVHVVSAWSANIGRRLVKAPKLYLTDTGVLAHVLNQSEAGLARDRAPLGQLLENFVASELLKQLGWSESRATLHHFRAHDGTKVDLVLEDASGRLVGVEVKAAATVTAGDFTGLRRLQADVGDRFHRGIVLHTGERATPFGPRLAALPVSALWRWQPCDPPRARQTGSSGRSEAQACSRVLEGDTGRSP